MNRIVYLFTSCVACVLSASSSDLQRARRKSPSSHLVGADLADEIAKLNAATRVRHARARPCEDFNVSQLLKLQMELHSMSDPQLELIYQSTADNRRMAAFGTHKHELGDLEVVWARMRSIVEAHPELHNITRDTLCIETVKWMSHHIPRQVLNKADIDVPLLAVRPVSTAINPTMERKLSSALPGPHDHVLEAYRATLAFQSCHGNVSAQGSEKPASGAVPAHPLAWPSSFQARLTEARDTGNVTGMHFYDSKVLREIIKRDTGKYDQLCGTATGYPTNSSCANLATSGKRYVFWPEEKQCCLCCTDKNGCGAVSKMWTKTATYQGQRDFNGRLCDMWLIMGGQKNYYFQDVHSGLPVAVQMTNQLGNLGETFIWDSESAKFNEPVDQSVFQVPQYCSNAEQHACPGWCAMLRKQGEVETALV